MIRKALLGLLGLVIVAAIAFFTLAPGIVERGMNKVEPVALKITPRARALHATLQVADMHADTLLWKRSLLDAGGPRPGRPAPSAPRAITRFRSSRR